MFHPFILCCGILQGRPPHDRHAPHLCAQLLLCSEPAVQAESGELHGQPQPLRTQCLTVPRGHTAAQAGLVISHGSEVEEPWTFHHSPQTSQVCSCIPTSEPHFCSLLCLACQISLQAWLRVGPSLSRPILAFLSTVSGAPLRPGISTGTNREGGLQPLLGPILASAHSLGWHLFLSLSSSRGQADIQGQTLALGTSVSPGPPS